MSYVLASMLKKKKKKKKVLRLEATSLLSQCESCVSLEKRGHGVFTGKWYHCRDKRRERGEPLRHWNQTAVCVTSDSHAKSQAYTLHAHLNPPFKSYPRGWQSGVTLSQDVRPWPQLLTCAMPQPQQRLQMEIQDVNRFEKHTHTHTHTHTHNTNFTRRSRDSYAAHLPSRSTSCQHPSAAFHSCSSPPPEGQNVSP